MKIQQKEKSVIINPESKVVSVPKTEAINPSKSPASTSGDSDEEPEAGTETSKDTKDITSQKSAKIVTEEDTTPKNKKQVVDLTGLSTKEGVTARDVDHVQLEKGIKVEMEHTKERKVAERIALDHLTEIPDYYDRLERMEREAKKEEAGDKNNDSDGEERQEPKQEPEEDIEKDSSEEPLEKKEKKQLKESTILDNLVNTMIISALENIEKEKQ